MVFRVHVRAIAAKKAPNSFRDFVMFQLGSLAIHDPSPELRLEGCRMIGCAGTLPFSILAMSLSKKTPNSVLFQNRMASLASFLNIVSDATNRILEPNLCFGVFIHATEDEFEAIRHAAVDSMYRLCFGSTSFAHAAMQQFIGKF
jgi:hypothetical protein